MSTALVPIALIDDQTLFRDTLADMIALLGGYRVVVSAANGREYIETVGSTPVAVAIVDLHMPVMDGYETLAWIRANQPGTRALALTFEKTEQAMMRALRAGACGFLLKDADRHVFRAALEQVATVGHYHDEELALAMSVEARAAVKRKRSQQVAGLSDRELEFVRLVCASPDLTYEEIAERMEVQSRTVDGYREAVFNKLGVRTKAGLVVAAYRLGIVS